MNSARLVRKAIIESLVTEISKLMEGGGVDNSVVKTRDRKIAE